MSKVDVLKDVLHLEAKALELAASRLTDDIAVNLEKFFKQLMENGGDLVFCGVGKSGIVGNKLASTFTSLGLRSFFLHPTEALHGDLGRLKSTDGIIFLSKSGTTEEILKMISFLPMQKEQVMGLLGDVNSEIAKVCGIVLDCSVEKEACINNQAPTTSSTLSMAMGDALAVLFEHMVELTKEGFAKNHPGGFLGKSLRMKVKDLMFKEQDCAVVSAKEKLKDVILVMTQKPLGACAVVENGKFLGLIVEGDIRRSLTESQKGLEQDVGEILNAKPVSVTSDDLAFEALKLMEERKSPITVVPVIEENKFLGFLRLHDLIKAGLSSSKK